MTELPTTVPPVTTLPITHVPSANPPASDRPTVASRAESRTAGGPLADLRRDVAALLPELRAFARFLARDRSLADDIVQDALVRALGALHQFQFGTNLKAWLFTIQRNVFYEQVRRRKREVSALEERGRDDDRPGAVTPHDISDLQRMIWTLPPLLREALILVGAQEMTHEEAAGICGVPVGTMKARLSRARAALNKAGAERLADGDAAADVLPIS